MKYMNFIPYTGTTLNCKDHKTVKYKEYTEFESNKDGMIYKVNSDGSTDVICNDHSEICYNNFLPITNGSTMSEFKSRADAYSLISMSTVVLAAGFNSHSTFLHKEKEIDKIYTNFINEPVISKYRKHDNEFEDNNFIWDRYKLNHATLLDMNNVLNTITHYLKYFNKKEEK